MYEVYQSDINNNSLLTIVVNNRVNMYGCPWQIKFSVLLPYFWYVCEYFCVYLPHKYNALWVNLFSLG